MENNKRKRQRTYSYVNWRRLNLKDEIRTVFYDKERGCDVLFCTVTETRKDHLMLTETGRLYGHYRIPSRHPMKFRVDDDADFRYYKLFR